ncbi:flavin-containing monooxygenase FMO GS-OX-like 3 isoform X3 [Vicia villosa]|uniref:flavin-containing monooxygenase FMO GS-OX-like 3 isoform X3 n=1 Tax=Vicia villosa TaxID=3911 RepID=UPI00273C3322|nr:flavin-containing monooxygenase FMO GS-OX-like 3 isoform X3 [Vicia villosa]
MLHCVDLTSLSLILFHCHHHFTFQLILMPPRSVKVAVIGAGVSGLIAAKELHQQGHTVTIFEKNNRIGGTWVYDPKTDSDPLSINPTREIIHSSLYHSLRTNLPRQVMGFLDYPFSKRESGDPRTFPGHEEVLRFLEDFAGEFGIHGLTRFETEVVKVERKEKENEWVVESRVSRGSDSVSREVFEAVVVCSGHFVEPKLGVVPGIENWRRFQMHSHNYRVPHSFKDQVVVLIGLGPSSFDISRDIADVAKEVHVATKPNPKLNDIKFEKIRNISFHTLIECVHEDGLVTFEDGFSIYADAIIHCTGYKYHIPFLETNGIVTIEDNRVGPLYKHVFPPSLAPWLSFIGLTYRETIFNVLELQAKWVARVLSGKILLPTEEEMTESVKKLYQFLEENALPKRHTHSLSPFQADYKQWLVAEIGLPPLEDWRDNMWMECFKNFSEMKEMYRDEWDDNYWDSIIQNESAFEKAKISNV